MPTTTIGPGLDLYRAQPSVHESPWHHACRTAAGHGGRFHLDCVTGRGTSYWADTAVGAILEVLAEPDAVDETILVTIDALTKLAVWRTHSLPSGGRAVLADFTAPRTVPRLTGEVNTTSDYALTQRWADAVERAGRDGVAYRARFANDAAVALFGDTGQPAPRVAATAPVPAVDHFDDLPPLLRGGARNVGNLDELERAKPPEG